VDVGYNSGKDGNNEPNPLDVIRAFIGSDDKEEHTIPQGRVIFLASPTVTPAIDLDDHGSFTKVIIDGLKGAADKYGGEADGVVTVDELDEYVEKELPKLAREHGKSTEEKQLVPFDWGARANHFVLTHNPQPAAKVEERLKKLAGLNLPADLTAEGKKLLSRMPKLESDRELRKQYQKLSDGTLAVEAFQTSRKENLADRKLPRAESEEFARKVSKGIATLREEYVKELNRGELVGWAVRGLYKRVDEKVPEAMKKRLDEVKTLDQARQNELLADVREQLGKREDLAENKDVDLAPWHDDDQPRPVHDLHRQGTEEEVRHRDARPVHRHRRSDPPFDRQGRPAGGDADQEQPGLQGRRQDWRPDHRDYDRHGREGQADGPP